MLEIEDLKVHFPVGQNLAVRAVDGISLSLGAGETVGLVGESGSGKSTVGKAALRLLKPTSGRIVVGGVDVTSAKGKVLRQVRRKAQMIFQDPHSSLNPRMTIFRSVAEPLILHTKTRGRALNRQVAALLERVGLPGQFLHRFPHELSGGQKQRVCIARALALNPSLLVLDEPTSALDVSVQAQILEFLKELHAQRSDMTSLFISHDLAVVRFLCSRVAVMYLGRIVEEGPTEQVFAAPQHPYTRALLSAVPLPQGKQTGSRIRLTGDIPSPTKPPTGCAFHPRCPEAINGVCNAVEPVFEQTGTGTWARCHLLSRQAA